MSWLHALSAARLRVADEFGRFESVGIEIMPPFPPGFFRLCLASIVVLQHFTRVSIGPSAVDVFFVLSGYWVHRMFETRYSRTPAAGPIFVASRFLRVLPMFLLFNTAAIILQRAFHTGVGQEEFLKLDELPNIFILGYASLKQLPMVPAWSLDIEIQFYILFPILFSFLFENRKISHKTVSWIVLTWLVAGSAYAAFWWRFNSSFVIPYLGFFGVGALSSMSGWRPSERLVLAATGVVGLATLVMLVVPDLRGVLISGDDKAAFVWNMAFNKFVSIGLIPIALYSVRCKSSPVDRFLGDLSYVIYCAHWLAFLVARQYFPGPNNLTRVSELAGLIALTYISSAIVLHFVDRPLGRLRERWVELRLSALPALSVRRGGSTSVS